MPIEDVSVLHALPSIATLHPCRIMFGSDMSKATAIAFALAAAASFTAHDGSALSETRPCRSIEYERNAYTICEADLRKDTARLYWKRSNGSLYAYLSALPRALEGEAGRLLFATNAGMYDPALKPVGLYVEGEGAHACQHQLRLWQFSHEAERGLLYIRRSSGRRGDAGISQAASPREFGDAIRTDAGNKRARASSFRPWQHLAQGAKWCGRTAGWQSHIRYFSGRGVV
jgi:hypothetical protein